MGVAVGVGSGVLVGAGVEVVVSVAVGNGVEVGTDVGDSEGIAVWVGVSVDSSGGGGVKVGRCTTMVAAVSGSCGVQAEIASRGRMQKYKMMLTLPILPHLPCSFDHERF